MIVRGRLLVLVLALSGMACPAAYADDELGPDEMAATLRELKSEISRLEQRVQELERQLAGREKQDPNGNAASTVTVVAGAAAPAPAGTTPPTLKGSAAGFTVTALSTEFSVGGRIKLDAIHSDSSLRGGGTTVDDLTFFPGRIPIGAEDDGAETHFSARESRIWFKSHTDTPLGDLAGYIEVDFLTSDATAEPRLRHAYGTYLGFTGGQTYTTFMNVAAYPEINDLNGPVAIVSVRQPLFRWTGEYDWGELQLAMEEPQSALGLPDGRRVISDADRVPDLIGKLRWRGAWGEWSLALMGREIRSRGEVLPGHGDTAWSASASIGGRVYLFERDNIRFNTTLAV